VKFDEFFCGERKRNLNFEYLLPFDDFSTSQEEGERRGKKTLSLDLCYACFGLVMGPYKPKTCTTRPKLCLCTTRHTSWMGNWAVRERRSRTHIADKKSSQKTELLQNKLLKEVCNNTT
jgi:hypothetical protein